MAVLCTGLHADTVGHKRTSKRSSRNKIVPETALPHHPLQPHGGAYAGRENAISVTSLDHVPLGPTAQPHVLAHSGKHDPNVHRSEASTAATLAYGESRIHRPLHEVIDTNMHDCEASTAVTLACGECRSFADTSMQH